MKIYPRANNITVFTPAKINLALEIFGKREDGYHEIVSLVQKVNLYDKLVFKKTKAGRIKITSNTKEIEHDRDNSVARVLASFKRFTFGKIGVFAHIRKNIPIGAGLGGESSDAAATIVAVNKLFALGLSTREMHKMAERIGADVPFFLNGDSAIIGGKGEEIQEVEIPDQLYYVLLVPPFSTSTGQVYANVNRYLTKSKQNYIKYVLSNLAMIEKLVFNRLQEAAIKVAPALSQYIERMKEIGFLAVSITGSGSGIFGLCLNKKEAQKKAEIVKRLGIGRVFLLEGIT
jgi:4-diphosphocytidyl-2-C-methyl-D-erythritol kinase